MNAADNNKSYSEALSSKDKIIMKELEDAFKIEEDLNSTNKYKKLQEALILYKQGDKEATEYIIKRFHNFISMYAQFICHKYVFYNVINVNNKTICKIHPSLKSFMYLYCSAEDKIKCPNKHVLYNVLTNKIYMIFRKFEYIDIYNELILALFNMANKYKITQEGDEYHKENGTFHMYVSKCFHYEAKRQLDKIINDPLNLQYIPLIDDYDSLDDTEEINNYKILVNSNAEDELTNALNNASRQCLIRDSNKLTQKENEDLDFFDIDTLNFNWTNGITCSEIFYNLTNIEREILVMYYIKKMTIKQLCDIYHTSRNVINKYKESAINKIKINLKEKR